MVWHPLGVVANGPQYFLRSAGRAFEGGGGLIVGSLNIIDGIDRRRSDGAFYTFAGCSGVPGSTALNGQRIVSDRDF